MKTTDEDWYSTGLNAEWCWGGGCTGDMEWRTVIGNIWQHDYLLPQK